MRIMSFCGLRNFDTWLCSDKKSIYYSEEPVLDCPGFKVKSTSVIRIETIFWFSSKRFKNISKFLKEVQP